MNTEQWELLLEAADYAYQAAARQAAVNAVVALIVVFLVILAGALLVITYWYIKPKINKSDRYAPTDMEMFHLVFGMIGIAYISIGSFMLLIFGYIFLAYILNPDWAVLQMLSTLTW
jgi:hypothetical protein